MSNLPRSHLGDRLSAFVDGELDHDARERVLVHLARCADCLGAVDQERRLKARIAAMADPDLPPGVADRLTAIATTRRPGHVVRRRPARLRADGRSDRRPMGRPHNKRRVAATTGAFLVGALGAAFAVGGGSTDGAPVTPNVSRMTVEHGVVSDQVLPFSDRGGSAIAVSFTAPWAP